MQGTNTIVYSMLKSKCPYLLVVVLEGKPPNSSLVGVDGPGFFILGRSLLV